MEELYYPSSENKGADQLRGYREADLRLCFRLCRLFVFPWDGSLNLTLLSHLLGKPTMWFPNRSDTNGLGSRRSRLEA